MSRKMSTHFLSNLTEPQLEDMPIEAPGLLLKSVSDQLAFLERVSQLVGKNMDELSQTMMKINAEISKKEKVNTGK